MKFIETSLQGAFLIQPEPRIDERGLFARTFCEKEFGEHNLVTKFVQCNTSLNLSKGTLRGMHFQKDPGAETKLVRCTAGRIFDVIVDIRPQSKTYLQWQGFELTAENRFSLYIPVGFAHGFQTLEDDSEVFYQMSEFYAPELASGLRFDDPAIGIQWPLPLGPINSQDLQWPLSRR